MSKICKEKSIFYTKLHSIFKNLLKCSNIVESSYVRNQFYRMYKEFKKLLIMEKLVISHNKADLYILSYVPDKNEILQILGDYFVKVSINQNTQLIVNVNAEKQGFPVNEKATAIYGKDVYGNAIQLTGLCQL